MVRMRNHALQSLESCTVKTLHSLSNHVWYITAPIVHVPLVRCTTGTFGTCTTGTCTTGTASSWVVAVSVGALQTCWSKVEGRFGDMVVVTVIWWLLR